MSDALGEPGPAATAPAGVTDARAAVPPTITAAVLARDEAVLLDGCLVSLRWADEMLVLVDDQTRDTTATIAARHTERVVVCEFRGFPHQRNRALDLAGGDWVLFVDADERVPPSLAA